MAVNSSATTTLLTSSSLTTTVVDGGGGGGDDSEDSGSTTTIVRIGADGHKTVITMAAGGGMDNDFRFLGECTDWVTIGLVSCPHTRMRVFLCVFLFSWIFSSLFSFLFLQFCFFVL